MGSTGPFLLVGFDGDVRQRSVKVSAALGEINHRPHCRLKRHLIGWAEAGPGTKLTMEPQHGFSGADANAPLQAQSLTLIGALKVQTASREEERRACAVLCARVRCERRND